MPPTSTTGSITRSGRFGSLTVPDGAALLIALTLRS